MIKSSTASFVTGALVCSGAALLFRVRAESDFMSQFGFAVSLAGQALLAWGLIGWLHPSVGAMALAIALQQALLFLLIPAFLHRLWCAGTAAYALVQALSDLGLGPYAPAFIASACAWIWLTELERPALGTLRRAAGYGLALVSAWLMVGWEARLLVVFGGAARAQGAMPELLGAALLGIVLVLAAIGLLAREGISLRTAPAGMVLLAAGVLAAATLKAPGLAPAILILVLGFANGNRVLAGLGGAALLAYLSYYYYALHATLLEKAGLLAATGMALLLARLLLLRRAWPQEPSHA